MRVVSWGFAKSVLHEYIDAESSLAFSAESFEESVFLLIETAIGYAGL